MITSGLPRTVETARIVAPGREPESWPDLREIAGRPALGDPRRRARGTRSSHAFRGVVPNDTRFLGGETIGELFDRVLPALERLVADDAWDTALAVLHGGVNRAILSYALTGERMFLGHFEQAPGCVNVLDVGDDAWIVRAVNVAPYDLLHRRTRQTTMEGYWEQYRRTELEAGSAASSQSPREKSSTSLTSTLARATLDELPDRGPRPRSCTADELHLADRELVRPASSAARRPGAANVFTWFMLRSAFMRPARVGFFPAL